MKKFVILFIVSLFAIITLSGCTFLGVNFKLVDKKNISGVFKSINRGETWQHKSVIRYRGKTPVNLKVNTKKLVFDPQDPLTIYLIAEKQGLWVSYNGAESWQQIFEAEVGDIAVHPRDRRIIYISYQNIILKSINAGNNWYKSFFESLNHTIKSIVVSHQNPQIIFALSDDGTVFKSYNEGKSWAMSSRVSIDSKKDTAISLFINPDSDILYATAKKSGIYRSQDQGNSFQKLQAIDKFDKQSVNLSRYFLLNPYTPSHLYYASEYGLLKSLDNGETWQEIKLITPPKTVKINSIAVTPYDERQIYYLIDTAIVKSRDEGVSWELQELPTSQKGKSFIIDPNDTGILYLGVGKK